MRCALSHMPTLLWLIAGLAAVPCTGPGRAWADEPTSAPVSAPVRIAQASGRWDGLRDRVLGWFGAPDDPAAALARQGGTRVVLKAEADGLRTTMLNDLRDEVRRLLRDARITYTGLLVRDGSVEVRMRDVTGLPRALSTLAATAGPAGQPSGGAVDVQDAGEGLIKLTPTERAVNERLRGALDQAIEIVKQRMKELGITAGARRDGTDRIEILLPGVKDSARLAAVLGSRAQLTFRLVDASITPTDALQGASADSEVLYGFKTKDPYVVMKQVSIDGRDITDATATLGQYTQEPVVSFRFSSRGALIFAQVTRDNVGRPFAIVLDNAVISAPIIREPILGGTGQISGGFTAREANDLAILLRAGMLPIGLTVIEQQPVEPTQK